MPAYAAEVSGLYQASAPIESRDNERQRNRAFAAAMRVMLVRLTGHEDVVELPAIQSAMAAPQTLVESWTYRTEPGVDGASSQLMLDIDYYQDEVQRVLDAAGIPLWPASRPDTLVWLIVQDESGERALADRGAGTAVDELRALERIAAERGLPVLAPLWDFEDLRTVRPELLWSLDEATLRFASLRYGYDSILAVRILKSVTGQIVGKAVHFFRDRVQEAEALDSDMETFLAASTAMVARELADNYAVRITANPATTGNDQLMLLSIEGVNTMADYAGVLHYLEGIAGVSDVQVREVENGTVVFALNAAGQVRQLVENLAIGRKLQTLAEPQMGADGFFHLQYRWQQL